MWYITIEKENEISQTFYKYKSNAEKQMKHVLIEYLNTLMLQSDQKIEVDDISNIETIEALIKSFKQTIHKIDKFDVTLSKCVFEDGNDDEVFCFKCDQPPVSGGLCLCNSCRDIILMGIKPHHFFTSRANVNIHVTSN